MHVDEGLQDATITGLAQGGTGSYTYSWKYDPSLQLDPTILISLSDSDKSVVHFDVPGVSAKTILRFDLTISDGVSTITEKVLVVVNDLSSTLSVGHLQDQCVHSGDAVYLNGAAASGGVPPYTYLWSETTSPSQSIALTNPTTVNPNFTAPAVTTSTPVSFSYTITDAVGNTVSVSETVTILPVILPLSGSLDGPDEAAGGADATFNAAVAGGVAPYTYTYTTTGVVFTLPATANPTVALPAVTTDTTATITLLVHDAATPQNTFTLTHIIKVTAPVLAAGALPPSAAVVCGDQATHTPCSLMELVLTEDSTVLCPADKPYAMNDIYQTGADVIQYRRCVNAQVCDEQYFQATSDKPLCLDFDPNIPDDLTCHLCCYEEGQVEPNGDLTTKASNVCNTLDSPPKDTLFRP